MSDAAQPGGSQFKVGNIENSTGFAIGNDAHVIVNQNLSAQRDEVLELLDKFIRLLDSYGESIDDLPGIRESAELARDETAGSSPKWQAVRRMLTMIAAGVAGVAALTDAINNIQALVARIG